MSRTVESFHLGSPDDAHPGGRPAPAGILVRWWEPTALRTFVCFAPPGGAPVEVRCEIDHPGQVHAWTSFSYVELPGGVPRTVARDDVGHDDVVPSYATVALVRELLWGGAHSLDVLVLREGDPELRPVPTTLRHDDGVVVEVGPDGPGNRHWFARGDVVRSDWQGAWSQQVDDDGVPALVDALPRTVAERTREVLVAGRPRVDSPTAGRRGTHDRTGL